MTFVGKILVIVIMVFALLFLGISTVAFVTAVNWKAETEAQKKKVSEQTAKVRDLTAAVDAAKKDAARAQTDHKAAIDQIEGRNKSLEDDKKTAEAEVTAARTKLEMAQESASRALAEAGENFKETKQLREQKSEVEKQANEYKLQRTELNDKIRENERQIKTLDENNKDLRDRVAKLSTLLRKNGLSDDITSVKGLESPPVVQGEVARVNAGNSQVEITIGSDDGIVAGHELFLYRTKPYPQYIGKIKILSADPDQAVGQLIGRPVNGIKIKEGDIVSSTIRPRS